MNESQPPLADAVIERALQGYAPETVQQASALVSGLLSILPLEDAERDLSAVTGRAETRTSEHADNVTA
ncbi:MAG TPA: hypothetical protein VFV64_14265 [Permianibacter sp.]|nr:hypothetical protein [Permianibacter sp.]